jgi:hypothetical protein
MADFTAREKAECAGREVKQREHVYGRLVSSGRMNPTFAQRQTDMMREIAAEYRAQAEAEESRGRLL